MKGKKKYLWALWLVILCALLMITGTYAAYISIRNAKSVTVAKTATSEIRFPPTICTCGKAATA